jgi:hypothetical protein
MDTLNAIYIAKQAGHAAIGILGPTEARIYAENLSFRFYALCSSEVFVNLFMDVYDGKITI